MQARPASFGCASSWQAIPSPATGTGSGTWCNVKGSGVFFKPPVNDFT